MGRGCEAPLTQAHGDQLSPQGRASHPRRFQAGVLGNAESMPGKGQSLQHGSGSAHQEQQFQRGYFSRALPSQGP